MPHRVISLDGDIAQVLHDWYAKRWNDYYADACESGWAHAFDIRDLLKELKVKIEPAELKRVLQAISNRKR